MFGSATNWLAILGCCSIIFWIICCLKLLSLRISSPRLQAVVQLVYGLLSALTFFTTYVFAHPVQILCKDISSDMYSEYVNRWIENDKKSVKKEAEKAYDLGLEYGMWLAKPDVSVMFIEIHWLLESYRDLYADYKSGVPFSEIEEDYIKPEHFFHDDLPQGD